VDDTIETVRPATVFWIAGWTEPGVSVTVQTDVCPVFEHRKSFV